MDTIKKQKSYKGSVLTIAGSDSGGGAGIQADIKTITMLGCYASSCVTAVTAQNTKIVKTISLVDINCVYEQYNAILEDIKIDAIKIGMLPSVEIAICISAFLPKNIPMVLDPVMISTAGTRLIDKDVKDVFKSHFFHKASLVTPNIPEAESLSNMKIKTKKDMLIAAKKMLKSGANAVLIKGGHLQGDIIHNLLLTGTSSHYFEHPRKGDELIHGTGCTLSSAIACFLAQGFDLQYSVEKAIEYLLNALQIIPKIGQGRNPVFHNYSII